MLSISRALRLSEPRWQMVTGSVIYTAGNPIIATGTLLWTAPFPCLVRALTVNDDIADPLVLAGGATSVSIGCLGATGAFVLATIPANYALLAAGWGSLGPAVNPSSGTNGNATNDSGAVLYSLGSVPGRPAILKPINAYTNAGTATGTLNFRFEMRPFVGAW